MKSLLLIFAVFLIQLGCSSQPIKPEADKIKLVRENPDKDDCKSMGRVEGRTMSVKGTIDQALEDMKQEAANKGANVVKVNQYSAQGTSVTGVAYICR